MHRQDELRELEDTLSEMDKKDAKDPDRQLCLQSREIDEENRDLPGRDRIGLLDKIEEKTLKYGTIALSQPIASGTSWRRLLECISRQASTVKPSTSHSRLHDVTMGRSPSAVTYPTRQPVLVG